MANVPFDSVVQHIRRLASEGASEPSDRELLQRFVTRRDEEAFTALVRRHGPMVLGVCRRVLKRAADAEDACQAALLVLARKAASIRKRASVGSWLHGVAYRVAWRLQRDLARRQAREQPLPASTARDVGAEVSWREVQEVLDEELRRLPEALSAPLVLCYLEGKTRDEAARELGWTLPTLRGRLERGRDRLRARLARRGLGLPAALLGAALSEGTVAALPAALVDTVTRAAVQVVSGTTPEVAPAVAALGEGVVRSMASGRLTLVVACLMALALGTVGLTLGWGDSAHSGRAGAQAPAAQAPEPPPPQRDPEEAAALLRAFRRNVESFTLSITLHSLGPRQFDPRFELGNVLLHVPTLRLEPHAIGPTGKPISANAGISHKHGAALLDALAAGGFFRRAEPKDLWRADPHALLRATHRQGNGSVQLWLALDWDERMVALLDALRRPLDGQARRVMDDLLRPLGEQPQPLAGGGAWEAARGWREGAILKGHGGPVWSVAFAPDGQTVASASDDGSVRLWDPRTGDETRRLARQPGGVGAVAFSPDGKLLATGGGCRTVRIFDARTGKVLHALPPDEDGTTLIAPLFFSQDSKLLFAGPGTVGPLCERKWPPKAGHTFRVWDVATGRLLRRFGGIDAYTPAALSPDGKLLATGRLSTSAVTLLDIATGNEVRRLQVDPKRTLSALAFAPDGKTLAIAQGGELLLHEVITGRARVRLAGHLGHQVYALAFSPDGRLLASGSGDATIKLWDVGTGQERARLVGHTSSVEAIAFDPSGKLLVSGSRDQDVRLWAVCADVEGESKPAPAWRERAVLAWPGYYVAAAAFDRDGKRLVAVGNAVRGATQAGPGVRVWDVATGKPLHTHLIPAWLGAGLLALAPDGRTMAVNGSGGGGAETIKLLDVTSGKELATLNGGVGVSCLAFSPDGNILLAGAARRQFDNLRAWDVPTRKLLDTAEQPGYVLSLAFLPNGKRLVTGSIGHVALRGDLPSLRERPDLKKLKPLTAYSVAVSADGKTLAVTASEVEETPDGRVLVRPAVKLIELATGEERATFRLPDRAPHGGPAALAFSPDGKLLAWALEREWGSDAAARVLLWDVTTQRVVASLMHPEGPRQVFFSPDGRTLATVGGVVRLWGR